MKNFIHTPYKDGIGGVRVGLEPIKESKWLEVDNSFIKEINKKKELFSTNKKEVFRETLDSYESQVELLSCIKKYLSEYYPDKYIFDKNQICININENTLLLREDSLSPLEIASFLVQEDLLLMLPNEESSYSLGAASLCAPSNWSLQEKFNNSLLDLHKYVPDYKEKISERVNKIFLRLDNQRIFERFNWSIYENSDLFQPKTSKADVKRSKKITKYNAGDKLFIRVERQTIRKLLTSGSIIFTVRVHVTPLFTIKNDLSRLKDLLMAIENLDQSIKSYKSLDQIEESVTGWLEDRIKVFQKSNGLDFQRETSP